jgi:hypothetical protein
MRMHAQTAVIENGFVHLPEAAPWLAPYLHELTVFPHGKHDDQVDSTAQLLDWFKRGAGPSSNAGSPNFTGSAPKKRVGSTPRANAGCICAYLPASVIALCSC